MSSPATDMALRQEHVLDDTTMPQEYVSSDGSTLEAAIPSTSTTQESPRSIHGIKWFLVLLTILSSIFTYSLDGTVIASITPSIVSQFSSTVLLPWLSVGFMAGSIVTVLPLGKLYSHYNAKTLYITSVILFTAFSALCAAAPNMPAMIIGRVGLGMSGNGVYFGVITLLSVKTSDKERPGYLSLVGLLWGIGTVLGPVVGGAFDRVSWRWAFYLNLFIGAAFAPVYFFLIPSFDPQPQPQVTPFKQRWKNFDWLGALLSVGSIMCLIMAINFGNALYPWNSGQIISLFVIAFVLFIAFFFQQRLAWLTSTEERMFPCHLLHIKEANLLFLCTACCNLAGFLPINYLAIYFQFTHGDTALTSAIRLLPLITILSAAILLQGRLMCCLGYYFLFYIMGSALLLVSTVLLSTTTTETSTAAIYGYEVLIAFGAGLFIQAGYATIQTVVRPADTASGIAFMMLAQFLGIVLGLSIGGAVFVNTGLSSLRTLLPELSEEQLRSVLGGTSSKAMEGVPIAVRGRIVEVIVEAMGNLYIPAIVASGVSLVGSAFLKRTKAFHVIREKE